MNRLSNKKRAKILHMMVEGAPMRGIERIEGVSIVTIARLLKLAGIACKRYHDEHVRNIPGKRSIQCDEVWSFVLMKQKRAPFAKRVWDAAGDAWIFTALDADTKLLISYRVTKNRNAASAAWLFTDLKRRLLKDPYITADALTSYEAAARRVFGPKYKKILYQKRKGEDSEHNTSYVERHNLTIRMGNRRLTRKTNAHSKRFSKHDAMMHLFFLHYNFCKIHMTLKVSPAMEAGVTDTLRDCEWIVELINEVEAEFRKAGKRI